MAIPIVPAAVKENFRVSKARYARDILLIVGLLLLAASAVSMVNANGLLQKQRIAATDALKLLDTEIKDAQPKPILTLVTIGPDGKAHVDTTPAALAPPPQVNATASEKAWRDAVDEFAQEKPGHIDRMQDRLKDAYRALGRGDLPVPDLAGIPAKVFHLGILDMPQTTAQFGVLSLGTFFLASIMDAIIRQRA
ncbi:MAG: hypothetical protein QOI63_674 [Thermoplasmata archaeon]|nr:hypothetical protein [Thermoplasmata archaeon]